MTETGSGGEGGVGAGEGCLGIPHPVYFSLDFLDETWHLDWSQVDFCLLLVYMFYSFELIFPCFTLL